MTRTLTAVTLAASLATGTSAFAMGAEVSSMLSKVCSEAQTRGIISNCSELNGLTVGQLLLIANAFTDGDSNREMNEAAASIIRDANK